MKKVSELQDLKGKVALVTGGAGYLGNAICETLAELGSKLIIGSRDKEKCMLYAKELNHRFGVEAVGVKIDITDSEGLANAALSIEKNYGNIDVLVNNAWSGKKNTFESISYEDWQHDIDVCLNGPFLTVKTFFDQLKKDKGVILNVASMYGIVSPDYRIYDGNKYANPPSYGAAKAGIIQLTKYLSSFLAPFNIRVNSISPGAFPFQKTVDDNPEFIRRLSEKTILGRIGVPEDLKGVIAFLCTDASSYVTGQNVSIDGGWTTW